MTDEPRNSLFRDEKGNLSAARVFLAVWLANAVGYIWTKSSPDSFGVVLTFFTAIGTPLVVWTAGPRIAQYLGPQVGAATAAVADAAKSLAAKVQARRNSADGLEETK
jgi:hypothetical protein